MKITYSYNLELHASLQFTIIQDAKVWAQYPWEAQWSQLDSFDTFVTVDEVVVVVCVVTVDDSVVNSVVDSVSDSVVDFMGLPPFNSSSITLPSNLATCLQLTKLSDDWCKNTSAGTFVIPVLSQMIPPRLRLIKIFLASGVNPPFCLLCVKKNLSPSLVLLNWFPEQWIHMG